MAIILKTPSGEKYLKAIDPQSRKPRYSADNGKTWRASRTAAFRAAAWNANLPDDDARKVK